jgi:hypothetical protein
VGASFLASQHNRAALSLYSVPHSLILIILVLNARKRGRHRRQLSLYLRKTFTTMSKNQSEDSTSTSSPSPPRDTNPATQTTRNNNQKTPSQPNRIKLLFLAAVLGIWFGPYQHYFDPLCMFKCVHFWDVVERLLWSTQVSSKPTPEVVLASTCFAVTRCKSTIVTTTCLTATIDSRPTVYF